MLKRILCALVALSALFSCCVSPAEQRPLAIPCPASLGDPEHQQVTAELYSAVVQGTGYTDELALDLHWPESVSVRTDYQMILEPVENDDQKAVYRYRGDIIRRAFDENGELTQENWENREARGEAVFSLEEDERVILRLTPRRTIWPGRYSFPWPGWKTAAPGHGSKPPGSPPPSSASRSKAACTRSTQRRSPPAWWKACPAFTGAKISTRTSS